MNIKQKTHFISRATIGFSIFVLTMAISLVMGGSSVSAASNFCKKQYKIPTSVSNTAVEHMSEQQKACQRGYDTNKCDGIKKTLTNPAATLKKACQKGVAQAKKDKPADTDTPEPDCSTSVLPSSYCSSNGMWDILGLVVNILATGIGLVAVGGFIYAAIMYATAEDNASQVTKAKMMMVNIVIGLVAFALMWGFLQFLIPGGIFKP